MRGRRRRLAGGLAAAIARALGVRTASVAGPGVVAIGRPTAFSAASSTTPGGRLVRYAWDVNGDGAPEAVTQSRTADLTFPDGGPAVLGLTVTNSLGRSSTTRAAVLVGAPPPRFTG